ncbi:hypothetical protein B0A50_06309 [Salinomyces thailandicus]|uniref:Uncharacterized protein n=1 Tax=Salinomyces thailandicus TaxID=706561 RepID=A0A4U0TU17_9PEZI|nr:hypothetical protein B0A50_06309 [Salinomyces thailandica]
MMASTPSPLPLPRNHVDGIEHEDDGAIENLPPPRPAPLSGPGASRQTRRLQLRNAGFRGSAVPTRKVTPKSVSSGTKWSGLSGIMSGNDAENMTPSKAAEEGDLLVGKSRREASGGGDGVLQEIDGTGSIAPTKGKKARVSSGIRQLFSAPDANHTDTHMDPLSPPPPPSIRTIKARSIKTKAKMNKRRSVSGETRLYVDHLEAELASAHAHLQTLASTGTSQEQSTRLRQLQSEARQLQQEVAEWETKYDDRVQELTDDHRDVEGALRAHVRRLEDAADETRYRICELETSLETARAAVIAAEVANVNLEKRLEVLSSILATSPTKLDLHSKTSGALDLNRDRDRKHRRPKSMLPRFPTASSLATSPERPYFRTPHPPQQPPMTPALPLTSPASWLASPTHTPAFNIPPFFPPISSSPSSAGGDAESIFSPTSATPLHDRARADDSMTTLADAPPTTSPPMSSSSFFNPGIPSSHHTPQTRLNCRPARRMRRFGAGAHGVKPLILPSTNGTTTTSTTGHGAWHVEEALTTPPRLDRSETDPGFTLPRCTAATAMEGEVDGEDVSSVEAGARSPSSSVLARRRAATDAYATRELIMRPPPRPLSLCLPDTSTGEALDSVTCRRVMERRDSSVRARSWSGGRNLMEELCALGKLESERSWEEEGRNGSREEKKHRSEATAEEDEEQGTTLAALSPGLPETSPTSLLAPWRRLPSLFSTTHHNPLALARHLVSTAQAHAPWNWILPAPLRSVQWWLVSMLLGPMARRRLGSTRAGAATTALAGRGDCAGEDDNAEESALAYGTFTPSSPTPAGTACSTSPPLSSTPPPPNLSSPPPRKHHQPHSHRSNAHSHNDAAPAYAKHSPWLWLRFSLTLAVAVGVAFREGPGSLLLTASSEGERQDVRRERQRRGGKRAGAGN